MLNSGIAFILNFFAVLELEAIPVLLSKNSHFYELEALSGIYGFNWLVTDVFNTEDRDFFKTPPIHFHHENYSWTLLKINDKARLYSDLTGTILQPTSGSTGEVKLCVRDESGCLAEPLNHIESVNMMERETVLCPLPLNHAYGFGTAMLVSLLTSSDLLLMNEFNPRKLIRVFSEYRITIFTAVPAMLDLLTKIKIAGTIEMARNVLSAGAMLEEEVARNFYHRFNRYIQPSYGSTETGEICIEREKFIGITGSVGTPLARTKVRIEKNEDELPQVFVKKSFPDGRVS